MNYSWECNGDAELSLYMGEESDPCGLSDEFRDEFSDAPGEDPLDAILRCGNSIRRTMMTCEYIVVGAVLHPGQLDKATRGVYQ